MRRGVWAGLTSVSVGQLMGCSHTYAWKLLKKKRIELDRELTLDDIGKLVQEYR